MPDNELTCTVVSFVPWEINEEKPGLIPPRYHIDASDTKIPAILHVTRGVHYVYIDETRGSLQVRDSPDEIARSIVEDFTSSQLRVDEGQKPALFWLPGRVSKSEVLEKFSEQCKESQAQQYNWLVAICRLADDDWNRYHQHNAVSDFQRKAAKLLNWRESEHEWMSPKVILTPIECPSCYQTVQAGTVVCPQCKLILDKKKHESMTFA